MHAQICEYECGSQRLTCFVPQSLLTLLSDTGFLTECEAHQLGYLVDLKALWISLSVSVQKWECRWMPLFFYFLFVC